MIYFIKVSFEQTIHVQAYGFTDFLFTYVDAENEEKAIQHGEAYYLKHYDLKSTVQVVNKALQQNPAKYLTLIQFHNGKS